MENMSRIKVRYGLNNMYPTINSAQYEDEAKMMDAGNLVEKVPIDHDVLTSCLYCCRCGCAEDWARANSMQINENGVVIGYPIANPDAFCECGPRAVLRREILFHYTDDMFFSAPTVEGSWFGPCPWCCTNGCNLAGDTIIFRGTCCAGDCLPRYVEHFNHFTHHSSWCLFIGFCYPISGFHGIRTGEGARVVDRINQMAAAFRGKSPVEMPMVKPLME